MPRPPPLPGALAPPLTGQDMTLVKRGREVAVRERVTEVWTCGGTEGRVDLKMEESRSRGWKTGCITTESR